MKTDNAPVVRIAGTGKPTSGIGLTKQQQADIAAGQAAKTDLATSIIGGLSSLTGSIFDFAGGSKAANASLLISQSQERIAGQGTLQAQLLAQAQANKPVAPAPASNTPIIVAAIAGGVAVLGLLAYVLTRSNR